MSVFRIVGNINEIKLGNEWIEATTFKSKDREVDENGISLSVDFVGDKYKIIKKYNHQFSICERICRILKGIWEIISSFGKAFKSQSTMDLFTKSKQSIRFGIKVEDKNNIPAILKAKNVAHQDDGVTAKTIEINGVDAVKMERQRAIIDKAKRDAQQYGYRCSLYIKNYGIDSTTPLGQQGLIDLAKLNAQLDGWRISLDIKNYEIEANTPEGQQALVEIAKLAAQQNCRGTSEFIENYRIDATKPAGQEALIEIATLAAQQNSSAISNCIQNYGIKASTQSGQQALIEIAKLAARQNGRETSQYIKNYGIDVSTPTGQKAMMEIAKLAAENDTKGTLEYIQNYSFENATGEGIQGWKDVCNYIFICLVRQSDPFNFIGFMYNLKKFACEIYGNGLNTYRVDPLPFVGLLGKLEKHNIDEAIEEGISKASTFLNMNSKDLQSVHNRVSNIKDKAGQIEFLEWWLGLVFLSTSREDLNQLFKENGPLFEKIFALPLDMRKPFTCEVIGSLDAKNSVVATFNEELKKETLIHKITVLPRDLRIAVTDLFVQACAGRHSELLLSLKNEAKEIIHAQLTGYILSQFPVQGQEVYLKVIKEIQSDRNFRDSKYQQALWEALVAIKNSSLDENSKIALVDKIFTKSIVDDRLNALKLLIDILNFKGESYLTGNSDLKGLKSAVEQLFVDKCKIKIDNFSTLYENTVGNWRSKECLLTYAAKHVENKGVLPYFQAFISSVLQGTFQQSRYAITNNPHLAEIQKYHPEIFEKWKLSAELKEIEIEAKSTGKVSSIEQSVVKDLQQAVENRHLGLEHQDLLFPVLSGCIGKWEQLQEALDDILKQLAPLSSRRLSEEELVQKQKLQLQKLLVEIMQDPNELKNKLNILKGIRIKGLDQTLSPFYKDLEDAIKWIDSSDQYNQETYKVIDTDDPNHFLLMGTEVLNSCQNVNGSASLNVGILGYACDGKHRLALVCDSSGKIVARSVLRLLIDAKGQPVIFQERMYVADANPVYETLLRKMALKKASLLGVPLVVSPTDFEIEQAKPYPHIIMAKGKPIPFEYVDALKGLQSGPYQICAALQVK